MIALKGGNERTWSQLYPNTIDNTNMDQLQQAHLQTLAQAGQIALACAGHLQVGRRRHHLTDQCPEQYNPLAITEIQLIDHIGLLLELVQLQTCTTRLVVGQFSSVQFVSSRVESGESWPRAALAWPACKS